VTNETKKRSGSTLKTRREAPERKMSFYARREIHNNQSTLRGPKTYGLSGLKEHSGTKEA